MIWGKLFFFLELQAFVSKQVEPEEKPDWFWQVLIHLCKPKEPRAFPWIEPRAIFYPLSLCSFPEYLQVKTRAASQAVVVRNGDEQASEQ